MISSSFTSHNFRNNTFELSLRPFDGYHWPSRSMNYEDTSDPLLFNMSSPEGEPKDLQQRPLTSPHKAPTFGGFYAAETFRRFHQHRISDSTADSLDSSPTTTISTVGDSSSAEPSPGSSPESPPTAFAVGMLRPRTAGDTRGFFELQKPPPPPKKGRNLKNLAVNTTRQFGPVALNGSQALPAAPATGAIRPTPAAFVKPPTPSKRKANHLGLTLLTSGINQSQGEIPPTPSFNRPAVLRHFQSSPSLPLVSVGNLPLPNGSRLIQRAVTLETIQSPREAPAVITKQLEEEEQNFDVPLSREIKPEAYPDGPICVYSPYIDLYLEPTVEQARQYDVIMNVAIEVANPFVTSLQTPNEESEMRIDGGGGIQYAPKRDRVAENTAASAVKDGSSPSTPKAPISDSLAEEPSNTATDSRPDPEYIHIPWEHNSDIVVDLLRLCKLIDEKVNQKKRVLIHCQCGVSRSASLVVAYGIYKNPAATVQEAYDAIKQRSKWIGPNMNLIMQLQEFRTNLLRGTSPDLHSLSPLSPASAIGDWPYSFGAGGSRLSPTRSFTASPRPQPGFADVNHAKSPSTSSSISEIAWPLPKNGLPSPPGRVRAVSAAKSRTTSVDPSGNLIPAVPALKLIQPPESHHRAPELDEVLRNLDVVGSATTTPTAVSSSPAAEEFAMTPLQPAPEVQSEDAFGLMSPTSMEFSSSPFDRSALLAQLGMGSVCPEPEEPRRSKSLRATSRDILSSDEADRQPRLRGKISSPTLREQHQLQEMQAKLEASLTHRTADISLPALGDIGEALMSPRATEFTSNPFALSLTVPGTESGTVDGALHPAVADPRSPPQKGGSPITRNIFDFL